MFSFLYKNRKLSQKFISRLSLFFFLVQNIQMNPSNQASTRNGWNDPPANLALSDNISTKRVLLNERVPYTNQNLTSTNNRTN